MLKALSLIIMFFDYLDLFEIMNADIFFPHIQVVILMMMMFSNPFMIIELIIEFCYCISSFRISYTNKSCHVGLCWSTEKFQRAEKWLSWSISFTHKLLFCVDFIVENALFFGEYRKYLIFFWSSFLLQVKNFNLLFCFHFIVLK